MSIRGAGSSWSLLVHSLGVSASPYPVFVIGVRYSRPARGVHLLARNLSAAGFAAEFPPPRKRRDLGHDLVHVTMQIGSEAEAGLVGGAAVAAVQRVLRAFKERHPEADSDLESDDGEALSPSRSV